MKLFKLIFRNALRHKLRTFLTILGIAIAVLAFVMLRTVVGAWYAGVDAASADRLIVRHAVSFIFPLPYSYGERLHRIEGVSNVGYAVWFQGYYKDQTMKNWFPRIAVDPDNYFDIYSEFLIPKEQLESFRKERNAVIVGQKTARQHGFKIGDVIPIEGDIYPGKWEFVVRGIYKGKDKTVDETQMLFDWKYLDEQLRKTMPSRAGQVGWFVLEVDRPSESARISAEVDALFKNSSAETRTETEKAFNQSFVSLSSAIIAAMNFISFVIIGIILLVLANTMAMTARERMTEYAVLKTLGFTGRHLIFIIAGESLLIAIIGGILGLAFAFPATGSFENAFATLFPVFKISKFTVIFAMSSALLVGIFASMIPALRAAHMRIVDGLRQIG